MKVRLTALVFGVVTCASAASAAPFNEFASFGDSSIDSGWWAGALQGSCDGAPSPCTTGSVGKDTRIENAIANGGTGAPVGVVPVGVGRSSAELLANKYGLTALPANQSGGTNYAIAGATSAATVANGNIGNLNNNTTLPSTAQQISNYLTSHGGAANAQALYLISSGGNDVTYALDNFGTLSSRENFLSGQALALAHAIDNIQIDGGQHILVQGLAGSGTLPTFFTSTLFSDLSGLGVNFIGADIKSLVQTVQALPIAYGFTASTVFPGVPGTGTGSACVWTGNSTLTGWGQWCADTTVPSTSHAYLASADAEQTSFYSDDQHFSAAGNELVADYDFSLVTPAGVPGPIVGAGLPGLLAGFAMLAWYRKRRAVAA